MTVKELLNEFTLAQEREDAQHPVQEDVEKKLFELGYKHCLKPVLDRVENLFHLSRCSSYEKLKDFIDRKHDDKNDDDYHWVSSDRRNIMGGTGSLSKRGDSIYLPLYMTWEQIDDATTKNHITEPGEGFDIVCNGPNDFSKFMSIYKKLLNGFDYNTIKGLKHGASRWNLCRGCSFVFGKGANREGFTLTDDYKIKPWNGHKTWENRNNPDKDKE